MFPGYHRTFWAHAGRMVLRPPDIPDRTLGIELWEYLGPVSAGIQLVPPELAARVDSERVARNVDLRLVEEEIDPGWGPKVPPEEELIGPGYNYGPPIVGV